MVDDTGSDSKATTRRVVIAVLVLPSRSALRRDLARPPEAINSVRHADDHVGRHHRHVRHPTEPPVDVDVVGDGPSR